MWMEAANASPLFWPFADLNVLDWSGQGHLAIALGTEVYILNTDKGSISQLGDQQTDSVYVSSLTWHQSGKYLAVGSSNSEIQVRQETQQDVSVMCN